MSLYRPTRPKHFLPSPQDAAAAADRRQRTEKRRHEQSRERIAEDIAAAKSKARTQPTLQNRGTQN